MYGKVLEDSLGALVKALCADYERREELIRGGEIPRRVDTELRYMNYKIYDAAAEIAGEKFSKLLIYEIGAGVGYAHTKIDTVSECTYKLYKKLAKENIAKKLYLT